MTRLLAGRGRLGGDALLLGEKAHGTLADGFLKLGRHGRASLGGQSFEQGVPLFGEADGHGLRFRHTGSIAQGTERRPNRRDTGVSLVYYWCMGKRARPIEYEVTERGCWVVTSHRPGSGGYVVAVVDGKRQLLHRWAWETANGRAIPDQYLLRHKCDNPPCINPAHLVPGNHSQNVDDAIARGRWKIHGSGRLTDDEVFAIRVAYADGADPAELAEVYKVRPVTIVAAAKKQTYRYAPYPGPNGERLADPYPFVHLDQLIAESAAEKARNGEQMSPNILLTIGR